ncbi:restriction endonuclease subunit S [Viscerimonas tarda]
MKRLDEIFDIWYGVNLELINCVQKENGAPFVSRQSVNNGIVGYVEPIDIIPNPANSLSIAGSGSVLATFFHDYEYYSGRDVYIAKPKQPLTKSQMLFYAYAIEQNRYRYNYGRQANKTLKNIRVPSLDELPEYVNAIDIQSPFSEKPLLDEKIALNTSKWQWFRLTDLFDVERGTRLTKEYREDGEIPLITAGLENEGVNQFIGNDEMTQYQNHITIDMFGNSFFRDYAFCCDDNILVLKQKQPIITKYIGIFIAAILHRDNYKYAYGRQYRQKNFKQHLIKLPTTVAGQPDWLFMENYIKSLPFSGSI